MKAHTPLRLLLAVAAFALLAASPTQAATHVWQGGPAGAWSEPGNWDTGIPTSGESGGTIVQFSTGQISICDLNVTVDRVEFTGGGNSILGDNVHVLSFSAAKFTEDNVLSTSGTNDLGGISPSELPINIIGDTSIAIHVAAGTLNLRASIANASTGKGGVRYVGPGKTAITSTNHSYTGTTTVESGTVELSGAITNKAIPGDVKIGTNTGNPGDAVLKLTLDAQIADAGKVTILPDGVLDLNGLTESFAVLDMTGGTVTAGTLSLNADILATASADDGAVISADLQLNAATRTINVVESFIQPGLTISGVISDGSTVPSGLFKAGHGSMNLTSSGNTYTGTTTVDRGNVGITATAGFAIPGLLVIGNEYDDVETAVVSGLTGDNNLPVGAVVTIHYSGLFSTDLHNERIGTLNGTGNIEIRGSTKLTIGTTAGISDFQGYSYGDGDLIKTGDSVLILGGENDYEGLTNINGGTLVVDGSLDRTSLVTVNAGTKLAGTGFISSDVQTTAASARIVPANTDVGTLTVTNMDFSAGGTLSLQIDESTGWRNDELTVERDFDIENCDLVLAVTAPLTKNAYILLSYDDRPDDSAEFKSISTLPAGYTLNYKYEDGSSLRHIALVRDGLAIAITGAPTNRVKDSAKLNGTINPPGGTPTSYYFQYGESRQYGFKTAVVKGLTASKAVSQVVTKLNGGAVCHFQLVANNSGGAFYGADYSFRMPGPLVSTDRNIDTTATTAHLVGTANPDDLPTTAWYEYGLTPKLGSKTAVQAIGNGDSDVAMNLTLTGLGFGKLYYFQLVATSSAGTSRSELNTFTTQPVVAPYVDTATESYVNVEGTPSFHAVTAVDLSPSDAESEMTFQWYNNGKLIPGATDPVFFIFNTKMAHAGAYTCKVSNLAGSATSGVMQLGVIEAPSERFLSQPIGGSATMTFKAAGNNLTYQWYKDEIFAINGASTNTLVLTNLQEANIGRYSCRIGINGLNQATAQRYNLGVNSGAPIILTPVSPGDATVGSAYTYQIPINTSPRLAPTIFTIKNLPAGLTVNASGLIAGRITKPAKQDTTYALTIKASNASGNSAEVPASLIVHPFPAALAGTYNGLIRRGMGPAIYTLDGGFGGMFTATITDNGACSGKFTLGATSIPFTLPANVTKVGTETFADVSGTLTRAGKSDVNIEFTCDAENGNLYGGVFVDPSSGNAIAASRNPWKSPGNPFANAGTFTSQITITPSAVGDQEFPQGRGYATITISSAGVVTWIAKLADGSAPATYSTTVSGIDQDYGDVSFAVHHMLYGNTGSTEGFMYVANDESPPLNGGKALMEGYLDWLKNPQPAASKDRSYKEGFPLLDLDILGGIYTAPGATSPVLGLRSTTTPGDNNARMEFNEGGLSGPDSLLVNRDLRVTPANVADFSNPTANTAALKLKIDPKTGLISGSFLVTDGGGSRTVLYNGLIIQRDDVRAGAGFFLRPGPTPTATTSPILSGEVLLLPP